MKKNFLILACLLGTGWVQLLGQANLYVLNPQNNWYWRNGTIEKATLSVRPAGAYFEMGLYLTFSSSGSGFSGDVQLETLLNFTLPDGSVILDSWLWVGDDIVQGRILDRWTASQIYEGIVNRQRDPSILMKNGKNNYEWRVYPMKPGETRKVKLTYLVPATWSGPHVLIPLPTDLLNASVAVPTLHTLVWLHDGWSEPSIPEMPDASFTAHHDLDFGNYFRLDIPDHQVKSQLALQISSPVTNGLFMSTAADQDGHQYYQLALDFRHFMVPDEPARMALMIDYEPANSSSDRLQVFQTLQQYLLDHYTPADSFNLFYSRYEIENYQDRWMPVTAENLEAAFQPLLDGRTLYSNLPGLLAKGSDFVKEHNGGDLLLLSNADNYGAQDKANQLIQDVRQMETGPIHVADFQNLQMSGHRIGNQWYSGQEYFFINLSRITGGEYQRISLHTSLLSLYSDVFASLSGSITAFDLYTGASDGFCYARYTRQKEESYHPGDYYVQTGRYMGTSPFTLNMTGLYDGEPFNLTVEVEADQIVPGDSLLVKSWYGQRIGELEWEAQSNEQINLIIQESIGQRVLSRYTAFLCLEPSDTVPVCVSCQDESRLTGMAVDWKSATDSLELYPNPCTEDVHITFTPPQHWKSEETLIRVTSVIGQSVFTVRPFFTSGESCDWIWDLRSDSGERVAPGLYFVSVQHGGEIIRKTLIIQ